MYTNIKTSIAILCHNDGLKKKKKKNTHTLKQNKTKKKKKKKKPQSCVHGLAILNIQSNVNNAYTTSNNLPYVSACIMLDAPSPINRHSMCS